MATNLVAVLGREVVASIDSSGEVWAEELGMMAAEMH